jgi:dihydrofolate reductase
MRKLVYSLGVSLDGFIAGPDGDFAWAAPGEELHRFHNERARDTGLELYGRRLYETMRAWETLGDDPAASEVVREFAQIWKETPKIVFSRTLDRVERNMTLVREVSADEIRALKEEPGKDIAVGGAGLASTFIRLGLVDEYRLFVNPVMIGAGTPFFPPLEGRIGLELIETRTFDPGVVYLRYRATE